MFPFHFPFKKFTVKLYFKVILDRVTKLISRIFPSARNTHELEIIY